MSDRADKAKSTGDSVSRAAAGGGDGREAATASARALYRRGVLLVLLSAVVLSLNGLVLRSIDDATAWQVIFYRSAALSVAMFGLFLLRHRRRTGYELRRAGRSALAAGPIMGVATVCFILSLSNTTVANTLLTLSSVPLFAAVLAWLVLGERVARRTWVAMAVAMAGIAVMVADGFGSGTLFGNVMALATSVLFAWFVVALRRGRNVDMTLAVCVGGAVSMLIGGLVAEHLDLSLRDTVLCLVWGGVLSCFGHSLFTVASRHVPAADLTLVALAEFVLGPLWVWWGVAEVPTALTLAGGAIVLSAIAGRALGERRAPPAAETA